MDQVDEFLAHYGVQGMKWGQRRTRQKVGIIGAGLGSYVLGSTISSKIARKAVADASERGEVRPAVALGLLPLTLAVTIGSTVLGVKATKRFLDRKGDTSIKTLEKKYTDEEATKKVEAFLKAHPSGRTG